MKREVGKEYASYGGTLREKLKRLSRGPVMSLRKAISLTIYAVLLLTLICILLACVKTKSVTFEGNTIYTEERLRELVPIKEGQRFFFRNIGRLEKDLMTAMPYAERIKVTKKLFSRTFVIHMTEEDPLFYVKHGDTYCLLNMELKVLTVSTVRNDFTGMGAVYLLLPEMSEPVVGKTLKFIVPPKKEDDDGTVTTEKSDETTAEEFSTSSEGETTTKTEAVTEIETAAETEEEKERSKEDTEYITEVLKILCDRKILEYADAVRLDTMYNIRVLIHTNSEIVFGSPAKLDMKIRLYEKILEKGKYTFDVNTSIDVSNTEYEVVRANPSVNIRSKYFE